MCRSLLRVAAVVLLSLALAGPAAVAQDATPVPSESPLAALGYPELRVRVTDAAIEAPAEAAAGPTLLTVENASSEDTGVFLIAPPPGMTRDEMMAAAAATPAGAPEEEFPPWFYDAVLSGGPTVAAGGQAQAVIDLEPGDWAVAAEADQAPAPLTVAEGEGPAAEPAADREVGLQEFAFTLPEQVAPGPQVWKLTNVGQQPHVLYLIKAPGPITMDQVMAILELPEGATPPPGVPNPEEFEFLDNGLTVISAGRTAWIAPDLAPGTYVAICFIPDPESGAPHAALGMVSIFTVGEGAAPGGTPAAAGDQAGVGASAVGIKDFAFNPATIEVAAGTTVTWTNQDTAPHTATAEDGSFDTGRLDQGQAGTATFDQPGTYAYICSFHPNMTGTVEVT